MLQRIRTFVPRRPLLGPVAAALAAATVLASAWVLRLSGTLVERSEAAQVAITGSTTTELVVEDDAGDVPLLDRVVLDPGEPLVRCINVRTRTLADPDPLVLHLDAPTSPLADFIDVELAGGADRGEECGEQEPLLVTSGSLSRMLDRLDTDGPGWALVDPPAGATTWWYRVELVLTDALPAELIGTSVEDLTLRWSTAAAERRDSPLSERAEVFVVGVTENAAGPLVLLLVGALMFLGVHDRIDADDPKLALAPVDRRTASFTDRATVVATRVRRSARRDPRVPPPPPASGPGTV